MAEYLPQEIRTKITQSYTQYIKKDPEIGRLSKLLDTGKATYIDAQNYAKLNGEALGRAVKDVVGDSISGSSNYFRAASEVLPENLQVSQKLVSKYAQTVQANLNKDAGYHIKTIQAPFNADRAKGLAELASSKPFEEVEDQLYQGIRNFNQNTVDETIKRNAEMQAKLGLDLTITRIYDGVGLHDGKEPCQWCLERAGTYYSYDEAYEADVFRRHPGCDCMILFSNDGKTTDIIDSGKKRTINNETGNYVRKNTGKK